MQLDLTPKIKLETDDSLWRRYQTISNKLAPTENKSLLKYPIIWVFKTIPDNLMSFVQN